MDWSQRTRTIASSFLHTFSVVTDLPPASSVVVSVVAAIVSLAVGAAIARGFRSVLRLRLQDGNGIALEDYDALVNSADGDLHYRFRWTSLAVFSIFIVAQLLGPSSQAAFGASPSTQQKQYVGILLRLRN